MLKKLNDFLAGLPMTIVAGAFLLLDLIPHLMEEFGGGSAFPAFLPFDPAWVTIIICGIPLLYLAVWRIIHNPGISKISSALLICIAMFAAIAIGDLFAAGEVAFIMAIVPYLLLLQIPIYRSIPCSFLASGPRAGSTLPPILPNRRYGFASSNRASWLDDLSDKGVLL